MLDRHIVQELFDPDYIEFLRKLVTLNVLRNPALGICVSFVKRRDEFA